MYGKISNFLLDKYSVAITVPILSGRKTYIFEGETAFNKKYN